MLFRNEHHFDFPAMWRKALVGSAVLVLVSVGALVFRGLNLGIEFEGGTAWEVTAPGVSVADTRDALGGTGAESGKIQTLGSDAIRVRADLDTQEEVAAVTATLAELASVDVTDVSVTTVGPSWGDQITSKARNALFWFFVIVAGYIAVRLEWKMAVGALVAVTHDILISVGVYAIFQFEVTPATVIAFLTIMGYSLYDTIVVYDKVRDVGGRLTVTGRYTYSEMMNQSLNQVLMRSINTSITSVLPVLSMLLIGSVFLGALTLQEFAIALLIGILVGTYSSIFVAASVVAYMKEREAENRAVADKIRAREGETGTRRVSEDDVALAGIPTTRERPSSSGSRTSSSQRPSRGQAAQRGAAAKRTQSSARPGQPPKPRKKKKS
ncbi:MAG: protein translocase subunit SecF [Actinomycetota bacterium]|jgi:preprotein translocase subunit SecF|nr:protein translocase subunit SecF [Actinomycetota bacterium]MEC7968557.1 protein translocase subunit SecF [Actinomycetota bacterium]